VSLFSARITITEDPGAMPEKLESSSSSACALMSDTTRVPWAQLSPYPLFFTFWAISASSLPT